jgi:hypothetical protein
MLVYAEINKIRGSGILAYLVIKSR